MPEILQSSLPVEMRCPQALPGVAPCPPDKWLRVDEAYASQMHYRAALMAEKPDQVIFCDTSALDAAREVLAEVIGLLPGMGFAVDGGRIARPDGAVTLVDWDAPLQTLGQLVQEDICILEKRGMEHVLTAGLMCFPANWRLAEKANRPLTAIHEPVTEYDPNVARRVQRLFDGVRVGRPLWRFNQLRYVEADLHQPYRQREDGEVAFIRSERQCIVRMPTTGAVVFTIHTYVVPIASAGITRA